MPYKNRQDKLAYLKKYRQAHYGVEEKARIARRRKMIRDWYKSTFEGKVCASCQVPHIEKKLEYHHKDPETKYKEISRMVSDMNSIELIKKEIEKCILLCRECHEKVHY